MVAFGTVVEGTQRVPNGKHGKYSPVGERSGGEDAMISSVSYEHPSVKRPLYSFAEADRIARVTTNTSRRWLKGYSF